MTQEKFEEILRKLCKDKYRDVQNGKRKLRLEKRRLKKNSLTDLLKVCDPIGPVEGFNSCIRTMGHIMEDGAREYAKFKGADVEDKKKYMKTKIDLFFTYEGIRYNLESKTDIELDAGKSDKEKSRLKRLDDVAHRLFDTEFDTKPIKSVFLVWTRPTAKSVDCFKKPLTINDVMGYQDFFEIFGEKIDPIKFEEMLRKVWKEEVENHFNLW
jgi:hypothetical protein